MRCTYGLGPKYHYTSARVWRWAREGSGEDEVLLYMHEEPPAFSLPEGMRIEPAKGSPYWRRPSRIHQNPPDAAGII